MTRTKTLLTVALAASFALFGQQPNWKDRAEFDLYDAITKEAQPAKRLELLNQWRDKYAASEFGNVRLQVYAQTYQQLGNCAEAINSANQLLGKDANNLAALNVILTCIYTMPNATPDQLGSAEKAANQTLSNIDTLFANKPQGVTDAQWTEAKNGVKLLAQNTVGYVAMQKKDNAKAEAEFAKSLQGNANQGQLSYWLGTVILAQKDPAKQSLALWHFARAAGYDGPGALPAQTRTSVRSYLEKAYVSYHGSKDGLDDLINMAKSSAFPPSADWKVESKVDIERKKIEKDEAEARADPQKAMWKSIREALTGGEAEKYFGEHMKGAELPPFKGKLISAEPETNPKKLVLAVLDGTTPDATLVLDAPLKGKMEPGAELSFSGIATAYTANPFMVTFDVEKSKLTGWKGAPAPAPAKKAVRPAPKKK